MYDLRGTGNFKILNIGPGVKILNAGYNICDPSSSSSSSASSSSSSSASSSSSSSASSSSSSSASSSSSSSASSSSSSSASSSSSSSSLSPTTWDVGIQITAANQTFGIQINGINPNITVDWGNGLVETFTTTGNKTRTYSTTGNYTVKISGSFASGGNIRLGNTTAERDRVRSTSIIPAIPGLANFDFTFFACVGLSSIPAGLFDNNPAVTSFDRTFYICSALSSIPAGLFNNNTAATNFQQTFSLCRNLISVPQNLFNNNVIANNFLNCFEDVILSTESYSNLLINMASNSANRPNNVFFGGGKSKYNLAGQTARQSLEAKGWTFTDLGLDNTYLMTWDIGIETTEPNQSVNIILEGISRPNITIDWGNGSIQQYLSIGSKSTLYAEKGNYVIKIKGNFANNGFDSNIRMGTNIRPLVKYTSVIPYIAGLNGFSSVFFECSSLKSVPGNLFANNPEATDFFNAFANCSSLESVPGNLFANLTGPVSFVGTFLRCPLKSLPANLFADNTEATTFSSCFFECNLLESIPANLFVNNIKANNFNSCFWGCLSIRSIPNNFFVNNTLATSFASTFGQCISLVDIPENLFANNIAVTSFQNCFGGCPLIFSIPSGLFSTNINASNFVSVFDGPLLVESYSNLLKNLASNRNLRPDNVTLGVGSTRYNLSAQLAREQLEAKNWVINDGGLEPPIPSTWDIIIQTIFSNETFGFNLEGIGPNITIDWGNGSAPINYNTIGLKNILYPTAGTYTIKISGSFLANGNISPSNGFRIRNTSEIPYISGLNGFNNTFKDVSFAINYPKEYLFRYNPNVQNFNGCFFNASFPIDSFIPKNLFIYNTGAKNFYACFANASFTSRRFRDGLFRNNKEAINFGSCFSTTNLEIIPPNLFKDNLKAEDFGSCFYLNENLTSIPEKLFETNTLAKNFNGIFGFCTGITSIPPKLFFTNTGVKDLSACFFATSIESIPVGLFDNNSLNENASSVFASCDKLSFIPQGLFKNHINIESFINCFGNCSSLSEVPEDLFATNVNAETFGSVFDRVTLNTNSYSKLLMNMAKNVEERRYSVDFDGGFSKHNIAGGNAKNLLVNRRDWFFIDGDLETGIGANSWQVGIKIDNPNDAFGIRLFPTNFLLNPVPNIFVNWGDNTEELFTTMGVKTHNYINTGYYNINISGFFGGGRSGIISFGTGGINTSASYVISTSRLPYISGFSGPTSTFINCYSLKSIPEDLLIENPQIVNISNAFAFCTSLTGIPEKLFNYNPNINIAFGTFRGCRSLESIPENLFQNNPEITSFSAVFSECSGLYDIKSGLFRNNQKANVFMVAFNSCSSLVSIPQNLFIHNTGVTTFSRTFDNCTSLSILPNNLFANNTKVLDFSFCFNRCTSLTSVPADLFDNNTIVNNFGSCFQDVQLETPFYSYLLYSMALNAEERSPLVFPFGGGNSKYNCLGEQARNRLSSVSAWTFEDGGLEDNLDCNISSSSSSSSGGGGGGGDSSSSSNFVPQPWTIKVNITRSNTNFGIQFKFASPNFTITWGDSGFQQVVDAVGIVEHEYINPGLYTITIKGGFGSPGGNIQLGSTAGQAKFVKETSVLPFIPNLTNCTNTFAGTELSILPEGLFSNNPQIQIFSGTFSKCELLNSIPLIFTGCDQAIIFIFCFKECKKLSTVNVELFKDCVSAETFHACFAETSLESIPTKLFEYTILAKDFSSCFYGTKIKEIPELLFSFCPLVENFHSCFAFCELLEEIPEKIFFENFLVKSFSKCFLNCTNLKLIPSDLFINCSEAENFEGCFASCISLTDVPANLFDGCPNSLTFQNTFFNDNQIISLQNIFDSCTSVDNFSNCFLNCSSLIYVPSNFFFNNTDVKTFNGCFKSASLTVPAYSNLIINLNSNYTQRLNQVPFSASSKYNCPAEIARNNLITGKFWRFDDLGPVQICLSSSSTSDSSSSSDDDGIGVEFIFI
jgi:hypothetical protein